MTLYAIELKSISKTIRGHRILDDISLSIPTGASIGIIGQNGSGKSMLFKVMSGLLRPDHGTVEVWGKLLSGSHFPENFSCLIESPGMLPHYSGLKNLEMLASIRKNYDLAFIRALMTQFGLNPDDKRPVRKYSLGMKQKLGIVQAFMDKPHLILLDEPTNNLDQDSIQVLKQYINALHSNPLVTTVLTSHDPTDISDLCTTVYEICDGKLHLK